MSNPISEKKIILPLIFGLILASGIFIGSKIVPAPKANSFNKISDVLDYVQQEYVDTINRSQLVNSTITKMLEQLDPHSAYIPADELASANEPLEGNFEGVGIEFHLQQDTIMVVSAISGGPSERAGIIPSDRIIKVDGKKMTGQEITNEKVFKALRGKGGTIVTITIFRRNSSKPLDFKITRGKIPIYSIDTYYMADPKTGYMKISRFAATTYDEFMDAMKKLKSKGMQNLILDLRGNPGGFLDAATKISDEFLDDNKMIVYTEGKSRPRSSCKAEQLGIFEKGKLIVLVDEGSASASEIVSGAVQDWDRATIVGRRTFGKGLVQEQTVLPDGSAIRLTIARYYTPTGRSIQKPYKNGYDAYEEEVMDRYKHGEFTNKDSIHLDDSLKYHTPGGKTVYGGGGIMPDIFVPLDTTYESDYLNKLFAMGLVNQFAYNYVDKHRDYLKSFSNISEFQKSFDIDENILNDFIAFSVKEGIAKDEKGLKKSTPFLCNQLKAYIARLVWQNEGLYPILHEMDNTYKKALKLINKPS